MKISVNINLYVKKQIKYFKNFIMTTSNFLITSCIFIIMLSITLEIFSPLDTNMVRTSTLTSILQVISTAVGIIFAISIIAVEHAASTYSPTISRFYKQDGVIWFIIIYSISLITFTSANLLFELNLLIINFICFSYNLLLLIIYLKYIMNIFDTLFIIRKIGNYIIFQLKTNPNNIQKILEREADLHQIIFTLYKKQELNSLNESLNIYPKIIKNYGNSIKNIDINNDDLIMTINERIDEYLNYTVDNNSLTLVRQLTHINENMFEELAELHNKKLAKFSIYGNLYTSDLISKLKNICKRCLEQDKKESAWELIEVLGYAGTISIQKNHIVNSTTNVLLELSKISLAKKDSIMCIRFIDKLFKIFQERTTLSNDNLLESDFKKFINFSHDVHINASNIALYQIFVPGGPLHVYVDKTMHSDRDNNADSIVVRDNNILYAIDYVIKVGLSITANQKMPNNLIRCLLVISQKYLNIKFDIDGYDHKNILKNILQSLSLICNHGHNNTIKNTNEITIAISEIGIICLDLHYDEYARYCIETICDISENMLDSPGASDPWLIKTLFSLELIGCYLLNMPNTSNHQMIDFITTKISDFYFTIKTYLPNYTVDRFCAKPKDDYKLFVDYSNSPYVHKTLNVNKILSIDNRNKFRDHIIKKINDYN